MATMNVNPTRMELKRLKGRLKTAARGHELLKDKTDEMVRRFIAIARQNKQLRQEVESQLVEALQGFALAKSVTDAEAVEEALLMPSAHVQLVCKKANLMNVAVPDITVKEDNAKSLPYGFLSASADMDAAVEKMNELVAKLVRLAAVEKTCNMLANEIEKNKRRVNALENIMIPQMQESIKYISMKLDENERASTVRLMKVKDIIQKERS